MPHRGGEVFVCGRVGASELQKQEVALGFQCRNNVADVQAVMAGENKCVH